MEVTNPNGSSTLPSFLQRYGSRIHGVLPGWARLRFRGTLRALAFQRGMSGFLFALGVAFKDFQTYVDGTTRQPRQATSDLAQAAGRPLEPFPHSDKEAHARAVAQRDGITTGLIGIFSATESCVSFEVRPNGATKKLDLRRLSQPRSASAAVRHPAGGSGGVKGRR